MKKSNLLRAIVLAVTLLLQLSTLCFHSRGAAGDVDLSFDPGSGVNGAVSAIAVQPDGKVIVAGQFTTVRGLARRGVARLNSDGSGDSSFDAGAVISPGHYFTDVYGVVLQPDGKVLVGQDLRVTRLNADGSFDSSFSLHAVGGDYIRTSSLVLQPDGKVLVGGYTVTETIDSEGFITYFYSNFVTRVFSTGRQDTSFANSSAAAECLALQPDGKVLVGSGSGIVRLNPNGSADGSFNPGANGVVDSVAVQWDGKVLIGGRSVGSGTDRNAIARLNSDGSVDNTFDPGAVTGGADPSVESVGVQPDGKILIGGNFTAVNGTNRNRIARLNANGSLDTSFNPGLGANESVSSVVLQSDGKVLIGGGFTRVDAASRNRIARLNADGSLDGGFRAGSGDPSVYSLVVQPDGKTLIGGDFSTIQDFDHSGISRLNADGSVDGTFNPGTGLQFNPDWAGVGVPLCTVALQSDGKVLIGGTFTRVDGTPRNGIARLHANGSLDGTFNVNIAPGDSESGSALVTAIAIHPDGKILIGGVFLATNGTNLQSGLTRLNADGSLDSTFSSIQSRYVYSIVLQPDGRMLVGGTFSENSRNGVLRLNGDGSLDGSFNGGAEVSGYVTSVALQSDGKVLVGGAFSAVNGANRTAIARLHPNGTLDDSFNPDIAVTLVDYPVVQSMVAQPDGKVIVGGAFASVNGASRNGIARVNADGSLDGTFYPGAGVTGSDYPVVRSAAVQSDGKLVIGGDFTTVNGALRPFVARLYGDSTVPSLSIARSNTFLIVSWPMSTGFALDQSLTATGLWSQVAFPYATNANTISITTPTSTGNKFYRLRKP